MADSEAMTGDGAAGETVAREPVPSEVDGIMAAWHRELPGVDVSPLAVFSRLSRLGRRLELARREVFGEQGLDEWEFDVLSALRRAGAPYELSPGELVDQTLVTSGTMTNRIGRLVGRGFVERRRSTSDGRGVTVSLTDAGMRVVDAALIGLVAQETDSLTALDAAERASLARLLQSLLDPFEEGGAEPR